MNGTLVLSLDFELMWGVRDHRTVTDYGDAVLGARQAIPQMLDRFRRDGIRATWATVGFLFARNRSELLDHLPHSDRRPRYADPRLSPYDFIADGLGTDARDDPWHYGRSLVDQIAETDGQEIASHTFSHYYCLEPGETIKAFSADLAAAVSIAAAAGHRLRSLVFPRNQMTAGHIAAAAVMGMNVYRGNPSTALYRPRDGRATTLSLRAMRLTDGILPLAGRLDFDPPGPKSAADSSTNVPASRFLRPYISRAPLYSRLHIRRLTTEITRAAQDGRCYHLWWHPHNMGRNPEQNIAQLDAILAVYRDLRDRYGMQSQNMLDLTNR